MSLRAFHIIFITIATLFSLAVAVWALYLNAGSSDLAVNIMGWMCSVAAVILPVYGVWFFIKSGKQQTTHLAK